MGSHTQMKTLLHILQCRMEINMIFFFFLSSPLIIMHVIMSAIFNSQQSPQHLIPNWHLRGLYKRSHKRRTQFVASDNCTKCHIIVEKSQNNTQPTQHYVHRLWHKVRFFFFLLSSESFPSMPNGKQCHFQPPCWELSLRLDWCCIKNAS